ncbi:MAG: putative amidohydrolase [Cognaticolwellia sp.]|jgi:predicted amidohydrolase
MRVAVTQFATSLNAHENISTCVRIINEVASCQPDIIVLPQYCNTQPCYEDHDQAWQEALALNGDFFQQIATQARKHSCYIVFNATVRRDLARDTTNGSIKSNISVTTCLISPDGALIQQTDQQAFQAHESEYFISTNNTTEIITTPLAKLGLLAGQDAITYSKARELGMQGAQLLCNAQSTNTAEQNHFYDLTRSVENNVFIATANNVGALMKEHLNERGVGTGFSQIVNTNGKVLAQITHNNEGFTFADIDTAKAGLNNKYRPDGTAFFNQHRIELYQQDATLQKQTAEIKATNNNVPETANVALFATYKSNEQAIEDVCHYIENNLSDIIQLPELFFIDDKSITHNASQLDVIEVLCTEIISKISATLRPFQYVCTSLVIDGVHQAVLINNHGVFALQQQLHFCNRYKWTELGDDLNIVELPLEQGAIKIAMLTADDANMPEIVKVAALNCIHVLLIPFDIQESSEVDCGLLSLAAENDICIVAASREKSFVLDPLIMQDDNSATTGNKKKIKQKKSTGLVIDITNSTTLSHKNNQFNVSGCLNRSDDRLKVKQQHGKITKALVHPSQTLCKS